MANVGNGGNKQNNAAERKKKEDYITNESKTKKKWWWMSVGTRRGSILRGVICIRMIHGSQWRRSTYLMADG